MPIYEYICRDCSEGFEMLISAGRRDQVECPSCGSKRTATHISLTAPAQIKSGYTSPRAPAIAAPPAAAAEAHAGRHCPDIDPPGVRFSPGNASAAR